MDEKKSVFNKIYHKVQQSFFDIMLDLLKEKTIEPLSACFLMLVMFLQVVAPLFEEILFQWHDQYFLDIFVTICDYSRLLGAINKSQNPTYYWTLYYFAITYITVIMALLIYLHNALQKPQYYLSILIKCLRYLLLLCYWIFFMPFYDVFISMFNCQNGSHYLVTDMQCFAQVHIVHCILASFGLLMLLSLNAIIALLYNETQPVKEDALSRLESNFEILMLFYRVFVCTFSMLCHEAFCAWVLIIIYLISSVFLSYQYFIYIPYYNRFVSVFFGSLTTIYAWVSINCLLTKLVDVQGQLIVILLGTPLLIYLVYHLRQRRIDILLDSNIDKIRNDIDALIQISTIKDLSIGKVSNKSAGDTLDDEMKVKGIINLHVEECKVDHCLCKNQDELYDVSQQQYLTPREEPQNEPIFVYHYNKKLYDDALNKFISSPNLHISFSYYLFSVMKNIHAALHELTIAGKKKPTIQQQFTIFRYKKIIEQYIQSEGVKNQHIYKQLTSVKEFERLHAEMSKSIESVCNFQVEFWSHLTTAIPDLNVLNELGNKIHQASTQADLYWLMLTKINPNYPGALQQYGEYLSLIRNHPQIGKQYLERAQSTTVAHTSIDDVVKNSEILFTEDTTVVHISGLKESSGRIVKVSQGLQKCFGYTKQEVIGHNINFLMPTIIGNRHNDFLDKFYKTGRERVFNHEREIFAQNKQGHCFSAKVLVKQMPNLKESIQYVGMLRPAFTEYDYIITDLSGNIDCFSKGITSLIGLNPQLFKENQEINIMLLCPELIDIFESRRKLIKLASSIPQDPNGESLPSKQDPDTAFHNARLSQPGGSPMALIVPQNFAAIAKSEKPQKQRGQNKKKHGAQEQQSDMMGPKINRSNIFREFMKYLSKGRTYTRRQPDLKKLLHSKEYKENEKFKIIQCELSLQIVRVNRSDQHALKYLVFMITKTLGKKKHEGPLDAAAQNDEDVHSEQEEQDQNLMMKNASHVIQDVFGVKDETGAPMLQRQGTSNMGGQYNTMKRAFTIEDPYKNSGGPKPVKDSHVDVRRENQQITGFKRVGFADDLESKTFGQSSEGARTKRKGSGAKVNAKPQHLQVAVTFIDASQENGSSQPGDEEQKVRMEPLPVPVPKSPQDKDTPRIDVKKDISINEKIKKKTASLNESISKKLSNNKFGQKGGSSQIDEKEEPSSSKLSSHKSSKQSLQQLVKPVQEEQQKLLNEAGEDSDEVEDMEEFEEEIEEIIEEEIEEEVENEEYGDEEPLSQQDVTSNSPSKNYKNEGNGFYGDFNGFAQNVQVVKKKKIRNYEKIVTNPRYRGHDIESCGSAYFKEWDMTNDELDIRDLIKKVEGRKQRREKRRKKMLKVEEQEKKREEKKEEKKDEENGSVGDEEEKDDGKEEVKEEEESVEDEEDDAKHKMIKEEIDEGEVSSIASSIFSQTRSYFSLRNSIDEQFVPLSIRNLKLVANFVFFCLLALDIAQFVIQQQLFTEVHQNIENMHYSQQRINDIIDLNLRIQNLRLANEGVLNTTSYWGKNKSDFITAQNAQLYNSATGLKDSQTQLSFATSQFEDDQRVKINPTDVTLEYEPVPDMPSILQFTIWEALIKIVVNAYTLSASVADILTSNPIVHFIQNNCLNSLLGELRESTDAIVTANDSKREASMNLFLYLLIAVSCAMLLALGFLLPVISRAKKSKQEVLELFLHKKIEKSIDDQLKLCRWFISKYQVQSENVGVAGGGGGDIDNDNADDNIGGMSEKDLKKEKEELYNMKKQKKKKKWRKLNFNFGFLTLRLLVLICILEGFFLATYMFSKTFMNEVSDLTSELRLLISRQPLFTMVLLMQKELFYTNGTAQVFDRQVREVLDEYNEQLIEEQQSLLEIFSSNYNYHTAVYNDDFNKLIYSNMCDHMTFSGTTKAECEAFNLGILQKGLYSTITKYLSQLRQLNSQFQILKQPGETAKDYLNDMKVVYSERTCDLYMKQIHDHLVLILEKDIDEFFASQFKQDIAIFIVFLSYLCFIYFFVWRLFLSRLLDELWKAKSMLSVLPIEICFKIEEIRNFIYANSSSTTFQ